MRELAAEDERGERDEEEAADEERDGEEAPEEGAWGDLAVADGCYRCWWVGKGEYGWVRVSECGGDGTEGRERRGYVLTRTNQAAAGMDFRGIKY